jgi:hypothetical protein
LIFRGSQSLVLPSKFADMNFKKLTISSIIVKNNPRIMAKLKLRGITYRLN